MKRKHVVLLSGGLDSMVALAQAKAVGDDVVCLGVFYGQRHSKELESARQIAMHYNSEYVQVDLMPEVFGSANALTGEEDVPQGIGHDNPQQSATVVPNRNMVFISLAIALASTVQATNVMVGCHAGDASIYADCRQGFIDAIHTASMAANNVSVNAPFLRMTKKDIVNLGRTLSVPFELAWTCYMGGEIPCGQCGSCVERQEAML